MSNRTRILRTLVVVGVVGSIAALGVFSAFSSQTDNPGNEVAAGTVTLADNDAGSAAYNIQNAKPGDTDQACIRVNYTGSLDATVKMFTPTSPIDVLGPYVNLEIMPGTQATPNLDCTTFVPDATGTIFTGTLSAFQSAHSSFGNGLADNPLVATKWVNGDAVVYRIKATLASNVPDTAQGDTTGVHVIRWEAQNQ